MQPCTGYDERLAASAAPSVPDGHDRVVTDQGRNSARNDVDGRTAAEDAVNARRRLFSVQFCQCGVQCSE